MGVVKNLFKIVLTLCFLAAVTATLRAEFIDDQRAVLTLITTKFKSSEQILQDKTLDDAQLAQERATLDQLTQEALSVALSFRPQLDSINKRLTELGSEPSKGAAPETVLVAQERARLLREKSDLNGLIGIAEDLTVSINQNTDQIAQRRRGLFAYDLYKRVDLPNVLSAEVTKTVHQAIKKLQKSVLSWLNMWHASS
jgi:potassium-dependent mechanosensitive channel